jgi:hypothetical protein
MKTVKKFFTLPLVSAFAAILSGCASTTIPLEPGAENVALMYPTHVNSAALTNCLLKGTVKSHLLTPYAPRDLKPTPNEIRVLKNKALLLGANTIVISYDGTVIQQNKDYDHVIVGNAYDCKIPYVDYQTQP